MKKITSILLALVMVLSVMTVSIASVSAEIIDSGYFQGHEIYWTFDDTGTLTATGTGPLDDIFHHHKNDLKRVIIGEGITTIGENAFSDNTNLESVSLPSTIVSIDADAFYGATSLYLINIPYGTQEIGDAAFAECYALNEITIPDTVTVLGEDVFWGCEDTVTVYTYATATNVINYCEDCGINYVIIPPTNGSCGDNVIYDLDDGTLTISGTGDMDDYTASNHSPFYDNDDIEEVVVENGVTSIGDYSFDECDNIESITVADSVNRIGANAFEDFTKPTDVITTNPVVRSFFLAKGFSPSAKTGGMVNYSESEITVSGNNATSIVTLDYETANLRVTVPTVLPVTVDSDNNVTVSDNAKIVNNSKGQVDVTNAVLSGNNSWTLAAFDTDFTKVPVDTKQYGFKLQGYSVPVSGNAFNNQFDTIAGNSALDLSYDANVAIQSEAISDAEIGNIVFTVAWHK